MDKASDFGSEDWGFESLRGRLFLFPFFPPFAVCSCFGRQVHYRDAAEAYRFQSKSNPGSKEAD